MALGKRKRRDEIISRSSPIDSSADETPADLKDLFQQHFEAKFKPLQGVSLPVKDPQLPESLSEEFESEWDGLSDNEAPAGPQVIQYHDSPGVDRETSKPPSSLPTSTAKRKQTGPPDLEDIASDAANLKKDLALQRLLKESHLLESQSALSVAGRNRHKAVDMRLQDLGSKTSLYTQQMPMAHRKGIAAKSVEKEKVRRREAQENGTILEKAVKVRKGRETRRQRSIGAPAVGKFQRGMLKLSEKDVAQIQGPKKTMRKKR